MKPPALVLLLSTLLMAGCATAAPPILSPTPTASTVPTTPSLRPTPAPPIATAAPTGSVIELRAQDFTRGGGCGDTLLWTTNETDTVAIVVTWPEAASAAQQEEGYAETVSLPDERVTVELQVGQFLSEGFCTDILMPDRPRIDLDVAVIAGGASIEVMPEAAQPPFPLGRANAVLTDLRFKVETVEGLELWSIDQIKLEDISVGWMAG
jgi:hypothetical protein